MQFVELALRQQEFARLSGLMAELRRLFIFTDVEVIKPQLAGALVESGVGLGPLHIAIADALDLAAHQHEAGLPTV